MNEDAYTAVLDSYLAGIPPGELRVALRGVLRSAFVAAAQDPKYDDQGCLVEGLANSMLTALELWARHELAKATRDSL